MHGNGYVGLFTIVLQHCDGAHEPITFRAAVHAPACSKHQQMRQMTIVTTQTSTLTTREVLKTVLEIQTHLFGSSVSGSPSGLHVDPSTKVHRA